MKFFSNIFIFLAITFLISSCSTKSLLSDTIKRSDFLYAQYNHGKTNLPYRIFYPLKNKKKYPVLIFLHGAGERGSDNELQLTHGKSWLQANCEQKGIIALVPQCSTNDFWSNVSRITDGEGNRILLFTDKNPTPAMSALMSLCDSIVKEPHVDPDRIYVMGLSMGGMGTVELLWRRQGMFAAAAPICGGGNAAKAEVIAETKNLWVFHGSDDEIVNPDYSRELVKAIQKYDQDVKYTEYKGVGHNSWDNVFVEPSFFDWLANCKRNISKK